MEVLEFSTDHLELEHAAVALARSQNPQDLKRLRHFLGQSEFLARLDDTNDVDIKTYHLRKVMTALEQHPVPEVADLCVSLSTDPDYLQDEDRRLFLLTTAAAVKPMTEETMTFFRDANTLGYFAINARLLAANGSPIAIQLFESMIKDVAVDLDRRVDCLHSALFPHRTHFPLLQMADRLISADLEPKVRIAIIESILDDQSKEWFGPVRNPPHAPQWKDAADDVLQSVIDFADRVSNDSSIPSALRAAINDTVYNIHSVLEGRKP
jgi:hypothetical protein